jgi:hypothetical protein
MGKAKGTTLVNAVKALRLKKEEARRFLPERLHGYLEGRVLVSSWYPEEDLLEILRALARVLPSPGIDIFEFMGRVSARTDLGGVYAPLLREGDPGGTLRRGVVVWRSYHDTGKHEVVEAREDFAAFTLSGFDHPSREICGTIVGWNHELVTLAGGKDARVVHTACVLDGAAECWFEVRWTP